MEVADRVLGFIDRPAHVRLKRLEAQTLSQPLHLISTGPRPFWEITDLEDLPHVGGRAWSNFDLERLACGERRDAIADAQIEDGLLARCRNGSAGRSLGIVDGNQKRSQGYDRDPGAARSDPGNCQTSPPLLVSTNAA